MTERRDPEALPSKSHQQAVIARAVQHLTTAHPVVLAPQILTPQLPDYVNDPHALAESLRDSTQAGPDRVRTAFTAAQRFLAAAGIPAPGNTDREPIEVDWGSDSNKDIAWAVTQAAERGAPLIVTLADGRVVRMVPERTAAGE
ncbi:hypothetical protein ACFV3E_41865 [Streptomyces sp. NPDC059718]